MTDEGIGWVNVTVRLGDLIPNPDNPKSSDEKTVERLHDSVDSLGQFETLAVDSDGVSTLDGHQRLNAWLDKYGPDHVVDARQASRALTDEEKRKLILYSGKGTHGQWDYDMLQENFELEELTDWGGFDADQFDVPFSEVDPPEINTESGGYRQMAFVVTDEQHEIIENALSMANDVYVQEGDNKNGVKLTHVCEEWARQKT